MAAGTQSQHEGSRDVESENAPAVSVCESRPGTSVFIESGNTDGWLASDTVMDVVR